MATLHLVHVQPHALTGRPAQAAPARAFAVITNGAYPAGATHPPLTAMARPDSVPYLETDPPGVNVYRLRMARGWSQHELARRCAPPMDPSAVSRVEHNQGYTQDSLTRIAAALGVPAQSLFYPPEIVTYARLPDAIRSRLADTIADAAAAYDTRKPPR